MSEDKQLYQCPECGLQKELVMKTKKLTPRLGHSIADNNGQL